MLSTQPQGPIDGTRLVPRQVGDQSPRRLRRRTAIFVLSLATFAGAWLGLGAHSRRHGRPSRSQRPPIPRPAEHPHA